MKRILVVLLLVIAGMWANKTFAQDTCKHCTIHCPPKACACGCHKKSGGLSKTTKIILARLDKLEAQQKDDKEHFADLDKRVGDLELEFAKMKIEVKSQKVQIDALVGARNWADTVAIVTNFLELHPELVPRNTRSISEDKYIQWLESGIQSDKHTRHMQNYNAVLNTVGTIGSLVIEFLSCGAVKVHNMGSLARNHNSRFNGNYYSFRGHSMAAPHNVRYPITNGGGVGNGYHNFGTYNNGAGGSGITNGGGY